MLIREEGEPGPGGKGRVARAGANDRPSLLAQLRGKSLGASYFWLGLNDPPVLAVGPITSGSMSSLYT